MMREGRTDRLLAPYGPQLKEAFWVCLDGRLFPGRDGEEGWDEQGEHLTGGARWCAELGLSVCGERVLRAVETIARGSRVRAQEGQ